MDSQTKFKFDIEKRDYAFTALTEMSLPKSEQALLLAIFHQLWPEIQPKCCLSLVITIDELEKATGLKSSTVIAKLGNLADRKLIVKSKNGKFLSLAIDWNIVYEFRIKSGPVQIKLDRSNSIGPIVSDSDSQDLDRSKFEPDELDRSTWTSPDLDRSADPELDRSKFIGLDLDRSNLSDQPQDCFTPLERIANSLEEIAAFEKETLELQRETLDVMRQLLDRSNSIGPNLDRSNSESPLIKLNQLDQRTKSLPLTELKEQLGPVQTWTGPNTTPAVWPFPHREITKADLQDNEILNELWRDAVNTIGWLDGLEGQLQFFTLAEYSLNMPANPGASFIKHVRNRKYGPNRVNDNKAHGRAKRRIAETGPAPVASSPPPARASPEQPSDARARLEYEQSCARARAKGALPPPGQISSSVRRIANNVLAETAGGVS